MQRDARGRTALHLTAVFNQPKTARLLIQMGAQVESRSDLGIAPLHHAGLAGATEVAILLLQAGPGLQSRDTFGRDPMMVAKEQGHTQTVRQLLPFLLRHTAGTPRYRSPGPGL